MSNRNNQNPFWTFAFIIGGTWLLKRILSQPKGVAGIFGIKFKRDMVEYIDAEGRRLFLRDLQSFHHKEISVILGEMVVPARKAPKLTKPLFKPLQGTTVTAELVKDHFRILLYRISADDYLMLSVFKKKTYETPRSEIEKAEKRLAEYLNR